MLPGQLYFLSLFALFNSLSLYVVTALTLVAIL